jgi:hypothetical protein
MGIVLTLAVNYLDELAKWAEGQKDRSLIARLVWLLFRLGMWGIAITVWWALAFGAYASCSSSGEADPDDPTYGVPSGK